MSDPDQTRKKLRHHTAYLCRLSANFLFIIFIVGCTFPILGQSTENFLEWRNNFALQLMERSYLPLIVIALYALSITGNEDRKHHASVYWKRLTILSALGILLYLSSLANSSYRAYSLMKQNYTPTVSYKEGLELMTSKVNAIKTLEEASTILETTYPRLGKTSNIVENSDLKIVKDQIKEIERENLLDLYTKSERQFWKNLRKKRFESIRYVIYSLLFIIFYFNLTLFFNRLHKSS